MHSKLLFITLCGLFSIAGCGSSSDTKSQSDETELTVFEVWQAQRLALRSSPDHLPGTLAQNRQGIFFQYKAEYLAQFSNLSPFNLNFDASLQLAPRSPHDALHGVFADSIPDGWGLLLMDRVFRQAGILPTQLTAMDRLAFVGSSGMGALTYEPVSDLRERASQTTYTIGEIGLEAQALFDGQTTEVLADLVAVGSSGGARPKAQLYLRSTNPVLCSTRPQADSKAYLIKFTSRQLALGHEEGLCEAAYLTLAKLAVY